MVKSLSWILRLSLWGLANLLLLGGNNNPCAIIAYIEIFCYSLAIIQAQWITLTHFNTFLTGESYREATCLDILYIGTPTHNETMEMKLLLQSRQSKNLGWLLACISFSAILSPTWWSTLHPILLFQTRNREYMIQPSRFFDFGMYDSSIVVRIQNATIRDLLDCPGCSSLRRSSAYFKQEVITPPQTTWSLWHYAMPLFVFFTPTFSFLSWISCLNRSACKFARWLCTQAAWSSTHWHT